MVQAQGSDIETMAIFFDLDGPILDVSDRYFRLHRYIVEQSGGKVIDKATYWRMKRNRQSLSVLLSMTGSRISQEAYRVQWLYNIESLDYLQYDTLIPGAREELERLCKCYTLILVTLRQRRENLLIQLKELCLDPFFTAVISTDGVLTNAWNTKQRLICESGFVNEPSLVVGDSEGDIRAGKALGLKTVAVLSGIRNHESLAEERPDFILENLNGLAQLVGKT